MAQHMKHTYLLGLLLSIAPSAMAMLQNTHTEHFHTHCPHINELVKNSNNIWLTRTRWQSFSPSFSEKLVNFNGAQWQGKKIGKLLCIYTDNTTYTFPVIMAAPYLTYKPSHPAWQESSKNNMVYNCMKSQPEMCSIIAIRKDTTELDEPAEIKAFLKSVKAPATPDRN